MRSSLTVLPRLERLLLDTDLDVDIQPYLEAVGFQTHFALHVDADERDDVALVRWARENCYILVCHDKHKDRTTRLELYPELNRYSPYWESSGSMGSPNEMMAS